LRTLGRCQLAGSRLFLVESALSLNGNGGVVASNQAKGWKGRESGANPSSPRSIEPNGPDLAAIQDDGEAFLHFENASVAAA
jgi:hypothetical protein